MDNNRNRQQQYIGFVSNSAWYIYIHRWDVIRFLISKGYCILIIAPEDRQIPAFEIPEITYIPLTFSNKSKSIFDSWSLYIELKKLYKTYRPLCLFHFAIKTNIFGNFAAKRTGVPCVSVIIGSGYSFLKTNWLYYLVKTLYRQALSTSEEVWFMNNEDAYFFTHQKLVETKKVRVLNGEGINTDYYNPAELGSYRSEQKFTFIIVTRFLYSKGISTIADSIRILKNKGYDFRCILLGAPDPGHPDSITPEVLETWQEERLIELIPFVEDVRPWLVQADCFLLPSYYNEGLPRSLMEAASMQLPIITTRQQGCKEVITENVSGLFCHIKDPVDLAKQMENMMNFSLEQRLDMGKAGRLLMQQKFAIERICQEYIRILKKIETAS